MHHNICMEEYCVQGENFWMKCKTCKTGRALTKATLALPFWRFIIFYWICNLINTSYTILFSSRTLTRVPSMSAKKAPFSIYFSPKTSTVVSSFLILFPLLCSKSSKQLGLPKLVTSSPAWAPSVPLSSFYGCLLHYRDQVCDYTLSLLFLLVPLVLKYTSRETFHMQTFRRVTFKTRRKVSNGSSKQEELIDCLSRRER